MRMAMILLLAITVLQSFIIEAREYDHCYSYESEPYLLMGTKTAYHFIRGTNRLPSIPSEYIYEFFLRAS